MSAIAKDVSPAHRAFRGVMLAHGDLIDVTDEAIAHGLPSPLAIEADVYDGLVRGFDHEARLRSLMHGAALAIHATQMQDPETAVARFRRGGMRLEIRSEAGDGGWDCPVYTIGRAGAPRLAIAA